MYCTVSFCIGMYWNIWYGIMLCAHAKAVAHNLYNSLEVCTICACLPVLVSFLHTNLVVNLWPSNSVMPTGLTYVAVTVLFLRW